MKVVDMAMTAEAICVIAQDSEVYCAGNLSAASLYSNSFSKMLVKGAKGAMRIISETDSFAVETVSKQVISWGINAGKFCDWKVCTNTGVVTLVNDSEGWETAIESSIMPSDLEGPWNFWTTDDKRSCPIVTKDIGGTLVVCADAVSEPEGQVPYQEEVVFGQSIVVAAGSLHFQEWGTDKIHFACAITEDGNAWCWGDNRYGQLGNKSNQNSATPVPVDGGSTEPPYDSNGSGDEQSPSPAQDIAITTSVSDEGWVTYEAQRISSSYLAAAIPSFSSTWTSSDTYSTGILTVSFLALLGVVLSWPVAWAEAQVKKRFLAITKRLGSPRPIALLPRTFGVRIDLVLFLIAGQAITQLNVSVDTLPPITQLATTVLTGAIAVFAISTWYALPLLIAQRSIYKDSGKIQAQWWGIGLASLGLISAQILGVIPGFVVGLFMMRRFRRALPLVQTANGMFISTLSLAFLSLLAWVGLEGLAAVESNALAPLRVLGDGALGMAMIAGSHGALLNLINPGDEGGVALRRVSLFRWIIVVMLVGLIAFALLSVGRLPLSSFLKINEWQDYVRLIALAFANVALITLIERRKSSARKGSLKSRVKNS